MADQLTMERCKCGTDKTEKGICPHCDSSCTKTGCYLCTVMSRWLPEDVTGKGYPENGKD